MDFWVHDSEPAIQRERKKPGQGVLWVFSGIKVIVTWYLVLSGPDSGNKKEHQEHVNLKQGLKLGVRHD